MNKEIKYKYVIKLSKRQGQYHLIPPELISLERGDQGEFVVSSQNWRISEASRVMGLLLKASRV